jgi:hypothetical protein
MALGTLAECYNNGKVFEGKQESGVLAHPSTRKLVAAFLPYLL